MKAPVTDGAMYKNWLLDRGKLSSGSVYVYYMAVEKFLQESPDIENIECYNNFLIKYGIKKRNYHYYSALRHYLDFKFGDESNLKKELVKNLIKPQLKEDIVKERKYLDEEKLFEIINTLQFPKHRMIALIQTLTGVRAGDILRIKRGGIIPENYEGNDVLKLVITGKRKKRNVVYIHDPIARDLVIEFVTTNIYNVPDYYFLEMTKRNFRKGKNYTEFELIRMNYIPYWKDLKQALQANGYNMEDFASHDFRRCYARRVWQRWKDINILQKLLNHRDAKTSLRYLEQSGLQNIDYSREMQK